MDWKDIPLGAFDEKNEEHVQALQEHCLNKGRVAFTLGRKKGRKECSADVLVEISEVVGTNISLDHQFNKHLFQFDTPGGSDYWWRWVVQMAAWWRDGYSQAHLQSATEVTRETIKKTAEEARMYCQSMRFSCSKRRTRRDWLILSFDIKREGLEAVVARYKDFLVCAQEGRGGMNYDTAIPEQFIAFIQADNRDQTFSNPLKIEKHL